jgi:hypothetical protein
MKECMGDINKMTASQLLTHAQIMSRPSSDKSNEKERKARLFFDYLNNNYS